jgi:uncharacterized repeat protein (TIGR01451 family)
LKVRVPAYVNPREDIEYHLCVENHSTARAFHVTLRNPLPANSEYVRASPEPTTPAPEISWNLGTLEANECRQILLILRPIGPLEVRDVARVQFEYGECVITQMAQPTLSLQLSAPIQAGVDDPVAGQVVVTNTGNAAAKGVKLTMPLPEGLEPSGGQRDLSWQPGTLAPGESKRFTFQAVAKTVGTFHSVVRAEAENAPAAQAEQHVNVVAAQLKVEVAGPPHCSVAEPATYRITVSNPGSAVAHQVSLTDFLPAGVTVVAAPEAVRNSNTQVVWNLGDLAAGAKRTVQLATHATAPGEAVHQLTVQADHGLTARADARTNFVGAPGLTHKFEAGETTLEPGASSATYAVVVENHGTAAADKVRLSFVLPEQLEFVNAKGKTEFQYDRDKRIVDFAPIDSLPPRGSARFEVVVKAVRDGEARLKAVLQSDSLSGGPVTREEAVHLYANPPATHLEPPAPMTPAPVAPPPAAPPPPPPAAPPPPGVAAPPAPTAFGSTPEAGPGTADPVPAPRAGPR